MIKNLIFFSVLVFSASAFAATTKKPLPSDWQTAVCNLYVFADQSSTQKPVIERFNLVRTDCAANFGQYECQLNAQNQITKIKLSSVTMSDSFGNWVAYTFTAIKDDLHLYEDNIHGHLTLFNNNGKVVSQTSLGRIGTINVPVHGGITRFSFECDPDVDYGPGLNLQPGANP